MARSERKGRATADLSTTYRILRSKSRAVDQLQKPGIFFNRRSPARRYFVLFEMKMPAPSPALNQDSYGSTQQRDGSDLP
jgi:hypothetical protein